ncbi:transglycosylase SLT domain-containing protein [Acinetobacter soli]|uniref:transglycosylase SLT domain-containing protein n=1 Tax=Acinetobacter soli TaxID=487316 RepID=UPI00280E51A9|nr:transglycosylase SLT domain-containing protein [Acinetobacter soli]MDQ8942243.1 transglycosylase SLT domain-containing protein [Acinetobacter soli]
MATASLGRLTLDLVAKVAGYTEPLSRAERETKKSTKAITDSFDLASLAVKGFGVVLGGLSVASVIAYSEKVITAGNDIQRFAKLANASVGQFQYYAKGAETAGISLESFADKLKEMQDRIGDFQETGGGPLADFFTNIAPRVGVTIQQFQKLSGPEALQLFYNSLEKTGKTANDITFYMESIISDSSLLIPLLEKNGQGFKYWGDAAEKAGAIMSNDMVNSLTEAKKNLQLMDLQWQGVEARLVNNIVPVLQDVAENWDQIKGVTIAVAAGLSARLVPSLILTSIQLVQTSIFAVRAGVGLIGFSRSVGVATNALTLFKGVAAFLGGPAGIAMLAFQAAIAGGTYYAMTRKTEDATDAFDTQGKSIGELVTHYNSLSDAKKRAFAYDAAQDLKSDTEAYENAKNQVAAYASGLAETVLKQGESSEKIKEWRAEFLKGGISADELSNRIGSLSDVSDVYNANMVKYASLATQAKTKMDAQKKVTDSLTGVTDKASDAQKNINKVLTDQARLLGIMPSRWNAYTQKQRESLTNILSDKQREEYIKTNVDLGWSKEKAEYFADYRNSAGLGYVGSKLDTDQMRIVNMGFNQKNYNFNKAELAAIAKVQGIAKANNFAQIEGLYGLPAGTLAALVLQESGGNPNAVSPTGAKGLFQTTGIYRVGKDLSTVEKQAAAAAKYISESYQEFGNLSDAITSYNSGVAGLKDYKNGGRSPEKRKEIAGYAPGVQRWLAGVNGKTNIDNSLIMPTQADFLAQQAIAAQSAKELSDKRKDIDTQYYKASEKLAEEHKDRVEAINNAYAGTKELKVRLAQESALYLDQTTKLKVQREEDYANLTAFETDRIKQLEDYYSRQIELAKTNTELNDKERAKEISALQRKRDFEISEVRREQQEQVQSAFEAYMNETEIVVKRYQREREEIIKNYQLTKDTRDKLLQANQMNSFFAMNQASDSVFQFGQNAAQALYQQNDPNGYARWSLQNQYSSDMGGLNDAYKNQVSGIDLISDEAERNNQLLAAHEQYLQARNALTANYSQQEADLNNQLYANNLAIMSSAFGSMGNLVKAYAGENSEAYQAMIMAQKAANLASVIMNGYTAISAAWASAPFPANLPAVALATAKTGLLQAALEAFTPSITGMAHNGIDNVPKEGTWLLDGGERVLNPKQNQDLTRFLNDRQSANNGSISIKVDVNGSGVSTSGANTQDQKQLGQMIGNAVRVIIRQEQRQGGLLYK